MEYELNEGTGAETGWVQNWVISEWVALFFLETRTTPELVIFGG